MLSTISIYKESRNNDPINDHSDGKNSIMLPKTDIFIKDSSDKNNKQVSDMIATIYGPGKHTIFSDQNKSVEHELKPYAQKEIFAVKNNSFSELNSKPSNAHPNKYILTNGNFDAMIHYNSYDETFDFYNKKKDSIGKFKAMHLINYVSSCLDSSYKFANLNENDIGCELVKNFILKKVQSYGDHDIELYDHNDSAFMGDIESLVRLNNHLHKYEEKELNNYLLQFDKDKKKKVKNGIKLAIYKLLIHTLKIISMAGGKLGQVGGQTQLKDKLLNYSVGTVYRITKYVQDELNNYVESNNGIENTLSLCHKLRNTLDVKMDGAIGLIKKQNENLVHMANRMKNYEQSLIKTQNKSFYLKGGNDHGKHYDKHHNKHHKHKSHKMHHKHLTTNSDSYNSHYSVTSESYNDISINSSTYDNSYETSTIYDITDSSMYDTTNNTTNSTIGDTTGDTTCDTTDSNKYTEDDYLSSDESDSSDVSDTNVIIDYDM